MSERETTPDITTELDALTKEVQQDREAGVFLHKSTAGYQHHVFCNASRSEPLGSSGCICTVVYKQDLRELEKKANRLDHLEAENARLNEQHKADNAMIRRVSERIEAELTAATSRAEQAERERDELKRSLKHEQAARLMVEDGR